MVSLEQLVDKINSGTFNPETDILSTTLFLDKCENKTLIEHLMPKALDNPALLKNTLARYNVLMQQQERFLELHQLNMAKNIRLACRYIITNCSLDNLAKVYDNITEYFAEVDEKLRDIFIRTSYRIILGQQINNGQTLQVQNKNETNIKKEFIRKMAKHPLYSTNRNPTVKAINTLTGQLTPYLSRLPTSTLDKMSDLLSPLLDSYDYYTSTSRTLQLQSYIESYSTLVQKPRELLSQSVENKQAHIDLLSYAYFEGSENMQKEVVSRIDMFIATYPSDTALHAFILQAFAPEPLGRMMYGMHKNASNILGQVNKTTYDALAKACYSLLKDPRDKEDFSTAMNALTSRELAFHSNTPASTRWIAYLLCMGQTPENITVTVHTQNLTVDDRMLLAYLNASKKLSLDTEDHTALSIASPLPVNSTVRTEDIPLEDLPAKNRITQHSDAEICSMLRGEGAYHGNSSDVPVWFHVRTSKNIEIDFSLENTAVLPGKISTEEIVSAKELARILILAFPATWKALPERSNGLVRPFAVLEHKDINKTHCRQLEGAHPVWILVYENNAKNEPQFLYDINIVTGLVEKGFFSKNGVGNPSKYHEHFDPLPSEAAVYFSLRGRTNNVDAKSGRDVSRSNSPG
jgi:hypothetical protein